MGYPVWFSDKLMVCDKNILLIGCLFLSQLFINPKFLIGDSIIYCIRNSSVRL